jgi:hypothetical protein
MVAAKLANLEHGRPAADKPANLPVFDLGDKRPTQPPPVSQPEAARILDVSERSVSPTTDVAKLPEPQQAEIVAKGEKEILRAARQAIPLPIA